MHAALQVRDVSPIRKLRRAFGARVPDACYDLLSRLLDPDPITRATWYACVCVWAVIPFPTACLDKNKQEMDWCLSRPEVCRHPFWTLGDEDREGVQSCGTTMALALVSPMLVLRVYSRLSTWTAMWCGDHLSFHLSV